VTDGAASEDWISKGSLAPQAGLLLRAGTLAKKKETTMSQMTSLLKALKHCEKVRVLVATATVAVRNAHAPVGSGASTSPAR